MKYFLIFMMVLKAAPALALSEFKPAVVFSMVCSADYVEGEKTRGRYGQQNQICLRSDALPDVYRTHLKGQCFSKSHVEMRIYYPELMTPFKECTHKDLIEDTYETNLEAECIDYYVTDGITYVDEYGSYKICVSEESL